MRPSSKSPNSQANFPLCIAGAHRSGTSMVTRLLRQCGLNLGREADLMPAQPDNPDGFWENLRFVALNDEILNQLGGAWDLPPKADEKIEAGRLASLKKKAQLLVTGFDPAQSWGWKDPRNSLTWPFWKDLLGSLKALIVVRNPLEAAYSMRKRNGTSYAFGLRLWEVYNRRILESTKPQERLITHYDAFFENPEKELKRVVQFAGLPVGRLTEAVALVTRGRRHTHFTSEQLAEAQISPQLLELYRKLTTEAGRSDEAKILPVPHNLPTEIKPTDGEMIPGAANRVDISVPDNEPIRRELAELRGTKVHLERKVAERNDRIDKLSKHLTKRNDRIDELSKQLTKRDDRIDKLSKHLTELDEELALARKRFAETNELLRNKSMDLADSEALAGALRTKLHRQFQATKKLLRLLGDFKTATSRLRSSRRWKIANPVAALRALFTQQPIPGYGHLEKIVSQYSDWRSSHAEVIELDESIWQQRSPGTDSQSYRITPSPPTRPIEFPIYDEVHVSIIIPVFNQFHFTEACLASIQEHQENEHFEIIVVDDGSTDGTRDHIERMSGVMLLPNEKNLGFIASCNFGAEKARGKYLVFLNNDTVVTAGWLRALRETFEFEPRAGLVGSKLVFPDGRLQEAGGIIWRDGSGWNRGKFEDPRRPEYNFLREVDYCSAACVMIPKLLFESLGGFDSKYAPCYYEDTDLAFKIRRHGLKILYQPLSEVIHFEGATGGTDLSAGAKKYQEVNRATFAATWANELAEKPANGDLASYEQLKPGQKRILVIDHHLPMPDRDSGSLRMSKILKILYGLGHRVTFVPDNVADIPPYSDELRKCGIEVVCYPIIKTVREYLERDGAKFDVVILSRCDFAQKHMDDVRRHAPQSRVIFDTVDLHFVRTNREAEITQDVQIQFSAQETKAKEYELIDESDETWVVSESEQQLLRSEQPDRSIEIVSNIVDIPGSATPFSLRRDFLFIGGFQHTPNIDAVLFFMREIYPLVQPRLADANFYIIGDKAPRDVVALASEKIIITGLQRDVRPYFESVKLSVAPLRWGAGVKGKINQSMGFGVPVIGTSVAVEGMSLTHREDILIADTPEDFAEALIEIYESKQLWERISKNGIEKTKAAYSIEVATEQLSRLLSDSHIQLAGSPRFRNESYESARPVARGIQHGATR